MDRCICLKRYVTVGALLVGLAALFPGDTKGQIVPASVSVSEMTTKQREQFGRFGQNLPNDFEVPSDGIAKKLLREYGAVFVARGGAVPPNTVVFHDQEEVATFQKGISSQKEF